MQLQLQINLGAWSSRHLRRCCMLTRILTALVGIPVAAFVVTKGGLLFLAAVLFLTLVGWKELADMGATKKAHLFKASSGLASVLLVLSLGLGFEQLALPIIALGSIAILIEGLYNHCQRGEVQWEQHTSLSALAFLYVGVLFAHLPLLRNLPGAAVLTGSLTFQHGEFLFWVILLGTWASDTFAYFAGRALGKHKFCSVSPKKTWEGVIAGFIGCVLVIYLLGSSYLNLTALQALAVGIAVGIAAPIGDLVESILKRSFEIKDSGKLFPGHGGVLDRFDSLLFAVPVAYYLILIH